MIYVDQKWDSLFNQLLVLVLALLDDVFQLQQLLQADVFLLQERLHLGRGHAVVLPKHVEAEFFTAERSLI